MELHDELEAAIGHGPVLPPPVVRLEVGRAALRRRRVVVGAAAAAVLVAAMAPFALGAGLATRGTDLAPAPPGVTDSPSVDVEPFEPGQSAPVDVDRTTRELVFEPGAVVKRRTDDVARDIAGESASLVITFEDRTYWVLLAWDARRADVYYDEASSDPDQSFDEFVAEHLPELEAAYATGRAPRGNGDGSSELPTPGEVEGLTVEGERFVSDGTVTILAQQPSPDLPESFAAASDETAAAYVEQGGVRYLVLSRPEQLVVVESAGHGASLEALLEWARQRYVSGEGLL